MKKKTDRYKMWLLAFHDESGAVAVIVAVLLTVLLGMVALAIDVGHLMVVRNELQNAADATALAGASSLFPQTPSGSATPEWSTAESQANSAINLNKSDGVSLANCTVAVGYWNMAHTPYGLQSTLITPGSQDYPAVQVTVRRSASHNGGPVAHWFAPILGIRTSDVSATATAVMGSPGTAKKGALFPVAVTKEVADQKNSYTCGKGTFRIGSSYHYPTNEAGQWTSFDVDSNNVPFIRNLIENGNPTNLDIGDNIWIQPGTKNTIYSSVPVPSDVILPVVRIIDTHAFVPIVDFICFHVTDSVGGSGKYIEGCFNETCYGGSMRGINPGSGYGVYAPLGLVQ